MGCKKVRHVRGTTYECKLESGHGGVCLFEVWYSSAGEIQRNMKCQKCRRNGPDNVHFRNAMCDDGKLHDWRVA